MEGHTDSRPIHKKFPNWELSSARAANMIHHLIEVYNVDDKRLAAVGYADTKPIVRMIHRKTGKNRRVVIYIKEVVYYYFNNKIIKYENSLKILNFIILFCIMSENDKVKY